MSREHVFRASTIWTGAAQGPTTDYKSYSREYEVRIEGKPSLTGSADPAFLGDAALPNPEDQLVAALSACHMLSYLALCARAGIGVTAYSDEASGIMAIRDKKLRFTEVTLRPKVTIRAGDDLAKASELHKDAHELCFIANSVNFPVSNEPTLAHAERG